jgi:putative ABC transport system permease protein
MTMWKQIAAVTLLNIRSLHSRLWSSLVIVVGMTCVIAVLLSMLSLDTGYAESETKAGDPGRALILSNGRENEDASRLTRDQAGTIVDTPGIRKDADGAPLAEGEFMLFPPAFRKNGIPTFVTIRGFGPKGVMLRPELKLVAGRMFRPGAQEIVVGLAAQSQLAGMHIGDKVTLPNGAWPVVGVYSTDGDMMEGELIADRDTLMGAVKREDFNTVIARLERTPDAMNKLKAALAANPALPVMAESQSTYYEHISADNRALFSAVAYATGGIMALGAVFGALNIMVGAVRVRQQEIGTLRALGFGALPVAVSVVSECLLLALTGAVIGSAIAWLLFNGSQTAYWDSLFNLRVTPRLIGLGLAWALTIALLGSLAPAVRAARLPIVEALRAT